MFLRDKIGSPERNQEVVEIYARVLPTVRLPTEVMGKIGIERKEGSPAQKKETTTRKWKCFEV